MCKEIFQSNNTYYITNISKINKFLCYFTLAEVINMMTYIKNDTLSAITLLYRLLAPLLSFSFIMIPFIVVSTFKAFGM